MVNDFLESVSNSLLILLLIIQLMAFLTANSFFVSSLEFQVNTYNNKLQHCNYDYKPKPDTHTNQLTNSFLLKLKFFLKLRNMNRHSYSPYLKEINFRHHEKSRFIRSKIKDRFALKDFEQNPHSVALQTSHANIRGFIAQLKDLYRLLGDILGVAGDVDKRSLSATETLIKKTLGKLKAELPLIDFDFALINMHPIDRKLYKSPDFNVRRRAIQQRQQQWANLLGDSSKPWAQGGLLVPRI